MGEFFENVWQSITLLFTTQIGIGDIFDIIIVSVILYMILRVTQRTKAQQVLKGLGMLLVLAVISSWLNLSVINWIFSTILQWMLLIVVIIFQPELRQLLEQLGRGGMWMKKDRKNQNNNNKEQDDKIIQEIIKTAQNLSRRKVGALIVIQQNSSLSDITDSGTRIDSEISSMLLENIFEPNTPLHDGAVVLTDKRIKAAGCFLPLSENTLIDKKLGTRHRAALGVSERTDAIALVISEETGVISYTKGGNIYRYIDSRSLRELLEAAFYTGKEDGNWFIRLENQIRSFLRSDKDRNDGN